MMEQNYTKIDHELPLIPLRGLAIFPYMILNFDIGREMSLKALDQAMLEDELVFLTSQIEAEVDEPTTEDFYHVGTICKVKQVIKLPGDTVRVLVEGVSRGKVKEINEEDGYFKALVEEIIYDQENADEDIEVEAFVRNVFDAFEEYINIGNRVSPEILVSLADIENVDRFIDTIASNIFLKADQKQEILEEFNIVKRLELLYKILLEEIVKYPLIFLEPNSNSRKYVEKFMISKGIKISPEFELGSFDLLLEFAKINLGIACVVKEFSKDYLEKGLLYEVNTLEEIPSRSIGVCYLKDVPLSLASAKFVEILSSANSSLNDSI